MSFSAETPGSAVLEGVLDRITFHSEDTQYTVAKVRTAASEHPVTVVGFLGGARAGETLRLTGRWEEHPRYGPQFKAEAFEIRLPATLEGIRKYLRSGIVKGIGPQIAGRIVSHFGEDTFRVLDEAPERITEVSGIGKAKAALIGQAWRNHHALRSLFRFLQEMEIPAAYAGKIFRIYGPDAPDRLREDPYRLVGDFPGTGFPAADRIAARIGFSADRPERRAAAVLHRLQSKMGEGHTFVPEAELVEDCRRLYGVEPEGASQAVTALEETGDLVREGGPEGASRVYPALLHEAEAGIAARLSALLSLPPPESCLNAAEIRSRLLRNLALQPTPEQLEALKGVFCHRAVIVTGGPGTGKTTLIQTICTLMEGLGREVALAAPTGRAARRLSEVTGREANTIHRTLGFNPTEGSFSRDRDNPLEIDAVVVDAVSMADVQLMNRLLEALPLKPTLVLVGDVFQLPSVGPGNVLSDLIGSGRIPVFSLTTLYRQAEKSPIVVNAHRIRDGRNPELPPFDGFDSASEFYFLEENRPEKVVEAVVDLNSRLIPGRFRLDPIQEVQVITPLHKGPVGTLRLNHVLQGVLNPEGAAIQGPFGSLRPGDKVMHLRNNYQKEVFNGELGTISRINPRDGELTVAYDGREVPYEFSELDEISVAYAISVHKSQGSEYPAVILPLIHQHHPLLQRNLLYTAVTRGKRLVVLVGSRRAVELALRNDRPRHRHSALAERLSALSRNRFPAA